MIISVYAILCLTCSPITHPSISLLPSLPPSLTPLPPLLPFPFYTPSLSLPANPFPTSLFRGVLSAHLHDFLATDENLSMAQATSLIAMFGAGMYECVCWCGGVCVCMHVVITNLVYVYSFSMAPATSLMAMFGASRCVCVSIVYVFYMYHICIYILSMAQATSYLLVYYVWSRYIYMYASVAYLLHIIK